MNPDIILTINALKFALGEAPEIIADVEALEQKIKTVAAAKIAESQTSSLPLQNPHRKNSDAEVLAEGDFFVWPDKSGITLFIPGDTMAVQLPLGGEKGWKLSGSDDFPTLTPSIFSNPPSGYHGYLTNGVFTPDLNSSTSKTAVTNLKEETVPPDQRPGFCE